MVNKKRLLKHFVLALLIVLAIFGIGLAGGVPLPNLFKREESSEVKIELIDDEKDDHELKEIDNFS